jgi:hypothetical protein
MCSLDWNATGVVRHIDCLTEAVAYINKVPECITLPGTFILHDAPSLDDIILIPPGTTILYSLTHGGKKCPYQPGSEGI